MKKEKGFTLIELLAVIVILAVIALIATPIVIGIIEDSKKKAVDNSANGILASAEYYYTKSMLDSNIKLTGTENVFDKLEYQGQVPENGVVYITQDGNIALAFKYGDTCYRKDYFDKTFSKSKYDSNTCLVSFFNQTLVGGKVVTLAINGNAGLYLDNDGIYRYKGGCASPSVTGVCKGDNPEINNYVKITHEGVDYLYRIISVEKEGIKVQGVSFINTQAFDKGMMPIASCTDATCPRYNANNTYCQSIGTGKDYLGCNIFILQAGEIKNEYLSTNDNPQGTVTQNSSVYEYLNNSTYAAGQVKALRVKVKQNSKWITGFVGVDSNNPASYSYESLLNQEQGLEYIASLALMTVTDYANASLDAKCKDKVLLGGYCGKSNWLYSNGDEWTLTPHAGYSYKGWLANKGIITDNFLSYVQSRVRPVGYLPSETLFTSGTGTQVDPYTLS